MCPGFTSAEEDNCGMGCLVPNTCDESLVSSDCLLTDGSLAEVEGSDYVATLVVISVFSLSPEVGAAARGAGNKEIGGDPSLVGAGAGAPNGEGFLGVRHGGGS